MESSLTVGSVSSYLLINTTILRHHLVIDPDEGVDIVNVPLLCLLHHAGHHRLRHPLPPVPAEGPEQTNVESIVLRELTAHNSGLHISTLVRIINFKLQTITSMLL